jgi:hypothetical protein
MYPVLRKDEGIYSRELLIVIARSEATKQSPVLILRLKSLLQIFFSLLATIPRGDGLEFVILQHLSACLKNVAKWQIKKLFTKFILYYIIKY